MVKVYIDLKKFEKGLGKSKEQTERALTDAVSDAVGEMFGKVIEDTPVDTGQLVGNYSAGIGTVRTSFVMGKVDPGKVSTIQKVKSETKKFDVNKHKSIQLANSAPYLAAIEFGHKSKQAPQGMVRINAINFESYLKSAVSRYKV